MEIETGREVEVDDDRMEVTEAVSDVDEGDGNVGTAGAAPATSERSPWGGARFLRKRLRLEWSR